MARRFISSPPPPIDVGGQAVLEGVMMRSPRSFCVAVRTPEGDIVVREDAWRSLWDKRPALRFLRRPGLRGLVVFLEALVNGMQALAFSAKWAFPEEDEADPSGRPRIHLGLLGLVLRAPLVAMTASASSSPSPRGEKLTDWQLVLTLAFSVGFALALFVVLPHALAWLVGEWSGGDVEGKTFGFHLIDGAIKMALFVGYLAAIAKLPDIRRVFQYHGAEHKVIYAYELGEPLTVESAERHTTLHPRCGTSFLLGVLLISILVFSAVLPLLPTLAESKVLNHLLLVFVKLPLMLPIAALAYEVNRWASRRMERRAVRALVWPGLALQRITTKEPSRPQLEVALTALRCSLRREAVGEAASGERERPVERFSSYDEVAARVPL